jgi:hypothetical protein
LHDTNTVHGEEKEHSTTVLGRAVQHLLSSICFCVKTFIWEEGGNVQSTFINFECVQKRARIWLTNFLHDTNTVHWEDKEHSTTVLGRAVQYLLSPIRYCVETCIWGGGGGGGKGQSIFYTAGWAWVLNSDQTTSFGNLARVGFSLKT